MGGMEEKGRDSSLQTGDPDLVFRAACGAGDTVRAVAALARGADPNLGGSSGGLTGLMLAARAGADQIVRAASHNTAGSARQ